jgi:hypothetical protein
MAKAPHSIYFTKIAAAADALYFAGNLPAFPDVRATRIARLQQKWSQLADLPEIVASLSVEDSGGQPMLCAMLRNGVTHYWRGAEHQVEVIDSTRGLMFGELRGIGGTLYACGAGRQVLRRGAGGWQPIDDDIFIDPSRDREQAKLATRQLLMSIDGRSAQDLYAVGTGGSIFHFDGAHWRPQESPTNVGLMRVRCYQDVNYICGYRGVLLRGGREGWRTLHYDQKAAPLLDMAMFGGHLYTCSEFALYRLEGEALSQVDPGLSGELTYGSLTTTDGQLISAGGETVLSFNGTDWVRIECPWNAEI